jgi:hypothetical protein
VVDDHDFRIVKVSEIENQIPAALRERKLEPFAEGSPVAIFKCLIAVVPPKRGAQSMVPVNP